MRRRNSPVQQWVDSIPSPTKSSLPVSGQLQKQIPEKPSTPITPTEPKDIPCLVGNKSPSMTVSAPVNVPGSPGISATGLPSSVPYNRLARDPSLQSDSSHCSSVESLLELRRADPEAILLGLGFGGCSNSPQDNDPLSRIPKRFLQPSKLKGIAINDFVKHQQETSESFDSVSLGYRGLTGSPYVAPSEIVQKIMERLREHESHETDPYACNYYEPYSPLQHNGTQSVLSPDNRQFLERQRSKSPDMRNKRMIIGQKSFAFGHDGDLIEIEPDIKREPSRNTVNNDYNNTKDSDVTLPLEVMSVDHVHVTRVKSSQKMDNKLSKQSSIHDSLDINDTDSSIPLNDPNDDFKTPRYNKKKFCSKIFDFDSNIDDKENVTWAQSNILQKHSTDIRRASEGSCEVKSPDCIPIPEGRRHSDSIVHNMESNCSEPALLQKRKTLKRQSRISDADATDYCNSFDTNGEEAEPLERGVFHGINVCECSVTHQSKLRSTHSSSENVVSFDETDCSGAKSVSPFSKGFQMCVQTVDDTVLDDMLLHAKRNCCTKEDQLCSCKEQTRQDCTQDKDCTECCCHLDKSKYWKEMRKIIRENKKLGNLVAKSNREMAEIREMLNSVLSVRMEPGF